MGEGTEVGAYSCWRPCRSKSISTLGNQCWGQDTQGICSKVLVPPSEQIPLIVAYVSTFVGQHFLHVVVKSLSKGVACGLRTGEVAAFNDLPLSHLRPAS